MYLWLLEMCGHLIAFLNTFAAFDSRTAEYYDKHLFGEFWDRCASSVAYNARRQLSDVSICVHYSFLAFTFLITDTVQFLVLELERKHKVNVSFT